MSDNKTSISLHTQGDNKSAFSPIDGIVARHRVIESGGVDPLREDSI